jgi:hypothetical protein
MADREDQRMSRMKKRLKFSAGLKTFKAEWMVIGAEWPLSGAEGCIK